MYMVTLRPNNETAVERAGTIVTDVFLVELFDELSLSLLYLSRALEKVDE